MVQEVWLKGVVALGADFLQVNEVNKEELKKMSTDSAVTKELATKGRPTF